MLGALRVIIYCGLFGTHKEKILSDEMTLGPTSCYPGWLVSDTATYARLSHQTSNAWECPFSSTNKLLWHAILFHQHPVFCIIMSPLSLCALIFLPLVTSPLPPLMCLSRWDAGLCFDPKNDFGIFFNLVSITKYLFVLQKVEKVRSLPLLGSHRETGVIWWQNPSIISRPSFSFWKWVREVAIIFRLDH